MNSYNNHQKKILILCDAFPPAFAPRMGYLCKYMSKNWQATVISEQIQGTMFSFLSDTCQVRFIQFYIQTSKWRKKVEWLFKFFLDIFVGYKDKCFIKEGQQLLQQQHFDLILCSTYRTFPLLAAEKLSKEFKIPFIADLRDIVEQYPTNEFIDHKLPTILGIDKFIAHIFRYQLLKQRNKILQAAKYVTTVSPWHVNILKKWNPNIELIYNGFDPEIFYPIPTITSKFYITFTGRLISIATRNPELLLKALYKLSKENFLSPVECRVVWYTDKYSETIIRQEAVKYNVTEFMDYHGLVPATEIPTILNQSSILLSLTNKPGPKGPKGFMTTKFFESLAIEKPILCIQSDEDCLEAAINEANAGLAGRTVEEVCEFLTSTYHQWKEKGFTSAPIRREVLSKYSRKEQAARFARIFDSVIANKQ